MTGATSPAPSGTSTPFTSVPRLDVLVFVIVASGLAWLVAIPLWRTDAGLASPVAGLILPVMMFTPCVATLAVLFTRPRLGARAATRLLGLWPLRPLKRTIAFTALAVVAMPVLVGTGILFAAALGFVDLDVLHCRGSVPRSKQRPVANCPCPCGPSPRCNS